MLPPKGRIANIKQKPVESYDAILGGSAPAPASDGSLLDKAKAFIGHYQQPAQGQSVPTENKSRLQGLWEQAKRGFDAKVNNRQSFLVPTPEATQGLPIEQRAGYGVGALAGDVAGDTSRGLWWRWNYPLAIAQGVGTKIGELAQLGPGGVAVTGFAAGALLDATSGNVNWGNMGEAGRPLGYQAVFATPEDPTKSEHPVQEVLSRYVFGRTGKLMPWEDFHKERPDVTPEEYVRFQEYLRSPGFLGVAKATTQGIDGAEAQFMGYRVPLSAAVQTGAALGGALAAAKAPELLKGRVAAIGNMPKQGRMIAGGLAGLAAGKVLGSFVD